MPAVFCCAANGGKQLHSGWIRFQGLDFSVGRRRIFKDGFHEPDASDISTVTAPFSAVATTSSSGANKYGGSALGGHVDH
jgi:hypothetical protein